MFGVWKRLFPCLSSTLCTKLETTLTIIVATAVLYNFVRRRNDPIDEVPEVTIVEIEVHNAPAGEREIWFCLRGS